MSRKKQEKLNQDSAQKITQATKQATNKTILLWLTGILLLTYLAFFPSLKNGFTNWDDNAYIGENTFITSLSGDNIKKMFDTDNHVSLNYHPITILSLAIDYKLSGYNPKTYHITNLLFHLFNTALVFWFIFLLSDKKVIVAAIVALFFGIHPMHVESVAWISERKDVLYVFFFMAALVVYYKYIHANGKNKIGLYVFILFLFLLSLLSKAMAVVLPLIFLLMDYYKGRKFDKYVILEKIPFFVISLLFGSLAMHIQSQVGAITKLGTFTGLQHVAVSSYGMLNYIFNLFLPIHLSCFYPYPIIVNGYFPIIYYVSPFIVLGIFILVFLKMKLNKILIFGFLFFCITIALVLQFISVGQVVMADRYSYLPYIGLLFPIAMGYEWLQLQTADRLNLYKKLFTSLLIICATASLWLTHERTKVWKNSDVLWTDVISKYPNNGTPYRGRGEYLVNKGAYDKEEKMIGEPEFNRALEDFNNSIRLNPTNAEVFTNRAHVYVIMSHFDLALNDCSRAIKLDSTDAEKYFNRAVTYSLMKQFDKAIIDYTKAITMKPDYIAAKQSRAYAYIDNGNFEKAIIDLNELIHLNATNSNYYSHRSIAYLKMGNIPPALSDIAATLKFNPNNSGAYYYRSIINKHLGKYNDALNDVLKAQSLGYAVNTNYINELQNKIQ